MRAATKAKKHKPPPPASAQFHADDLAALTTQLRPRFTAWRFLVDADLHDAEPLLALLTRHLPDNMAALSGLPLRYRRLVDLSTHTTDVFTHAIRCIMTWKMGARRLAPAVAPEGPGAAVPGDVIIGGEPPLDEHMV